MELIQPCKIEIAHMNLLDRAKLYPAQLRS